MGLNKSRDLRYGPRSESKSGMDDVFLDRPKSLGPLMLRFVTMRLRMIGVVD